MISMFLITASRVRSSAMKASKFIPATYRRTLPHASTMSSA